MEIDRNSKRFQNALNHAKTKQLGTFLQKFVARDLQKAIRAEAGAFVGRVKAVVGGKVATIESKLGEVVCVTCGKVMPWSASGTHAGHFVPGRAASIVLEEIGIHPQCYVCNEQLSGSQAAYEKYMLEVYGQEVIDELRAMARETKQWDREELVVKRYGYRERIKRAETILKHGGDAVETETEQVPLVADGHQLSDELEGVAREIRKAVRETVIVVGHLLRTHLDDVEHGDRRWYIEEKCGMEYRTAMRAISVAKAFAGIEGATRADIAVSAFYELSSDQVSDDARREAVEVAKTQTFTRAMALEVIAGQDKPAQGPDVKRDNLSQTPTGSPILGEIVDEYDDEEPDDVEYEDDTDIYEESEPVDPDQSVDQSVSFASQHRELWVRADEMGRLAIILDIESTPEYEARHA